MSVPSAESAISMPSKMVSAAEVSPFLFKLALDSNEAAAFAAGDARELARGALQPLGLSPCARAHPERRDRGRSGARARPGAPPVRPGCPHRARRGGAAVAR